MRFLRFLRTAPVVAALAATGCATLQTNGSTQRVEVSSTPPAAEVFLDGQAVGVTPVEVVVSRRDPIPAIRIEKDGFRPSEQKLRRSTSWWLLADVGVGVLISIFALAHRQADGVDPHFGHTAGVAAGAMPVVLDYLTGAAFRFQPRRVDATLAPARARRMTVPDGLIEGLLPRRPAAAGGGDAPTTRFRKTPATGLSGAPKEPRCVPSPGPPPGSTPRFADPLMTSLCTQPSRRATDPLCGSSCITPAAATNAYDGGLIDVLDDSDNALVARDGSLQPHPSGTLTFRPLLRGRVPSAEVGLTSQPRRLVPAGAAPPGAVSADLDVRPCAPIEPSTPRAAVAVDPGRVRAPAAADPTPVLRRHSVDFGGVWTRLPTLRLCATREGTCASVGAAAAVRALTSPRRVPAMKDQFSGHP